ncbi:BMC domain-containing protein [Helicovermis profundi]|uniref:BMC domain-containing protein n=1 Tax=Helicovermis profundi TaxID=3065157 RepID=A0AAU9EEL2_9FIRM|nr:BMC domain-containing protein [Clostridia bacterium S502]
MGKAIGVMEFRSIGKGIESLDAMLKCASVSVILSRIICIGKYFVIITGDVAAVENAINTGNIIGTNEVKGSLIIPSVAEGVLEKINVKIDKSDIKALGIVETKSLAYGILAANSVKKSSNVELLKVSIMLGLGGKCLVLFTGDVASVESALEYTKNKINDNPKIVSAISIPSPSKELIDAL